VPCPKWVKVEIVRYLITLQPELRSEPAVVTLDEGPGGALSAHVDGRKVEIDVAWIGPQASLLVDHHVVDVAASGTLPDLVLVGSGSRARVHVQTDRIGAAPPTVRRPAQTTTSCSPMPGRVIRVAVHAGDSVRKGQTLVVLEAMKMENEVLAAGDGTVLEVHVTVGAAVEANAKLVTVRGAAT
jgi:glutaconyl-CoA/methylmalonyl-CoA decarboxylase subunit gamma